MSETQTWRDQRERRYELSRVATERVLDSLSNRLPVVTFNSGPATTLVATVYYDTEKFYYLNRAKTGNGVSAIKIRAREYFPVSDDEERKVLGYSSNCYLERKERTGNIRNKDRVKIAKKDLAPIIDHSITLPEDCDVLRNEISLHELKPVLISMYERRVWGSGDDLRITLDERIRYYRPPETVYGDLQSFAPDILGPPTALGPKRILEVKHSAQNALPQWLSTLLDALPEAVGFSKFIHGMSSLQDQQRAKSSLTRPVYSIP